MEQKPQHPEHPTDNQQQAQAQTIKSRRLLKTIKEKESKYKFYSWDFVQNYAYITYLSNFRYIFNSHTERKRVKVFRHLAKLIKTRNPHQIKSHHQKMMLRHKTVDGIIDFLKGKITKEINIKPEYIPIIERINAEAEIFFIKEIAQARCAPPESSSNSKNIKVQQSSSQSEEEVFVKAEPQAAAHEPPLVKQQERFETFNFPVLLKQEQCDPLIWFSQN